MCDFNSSWKKKCKEQSLEIDRLRARITELERPEPPAQERPSPSGIMSWTEVLAYTDRVEIPGEWQIAHIADTNSMDRVFDTGHILMVRPPTDDEALSLKVGDIAIYEADNKQIFHAVKAVEQDAQGKYYTFEGINNVGYPDHYKVRPEDIVYLIGGWFNTYY